ncbi:MAG: hypothetical protein J6K98_00130 [Clostridia bacterium]|nr:hypothetical protein [Clostridia bacterium]
MKRYIWIIIGLCLGILLLFIGIIGVLGLQSDPSPASSDTGESTALPREAGWILGVWEGKLAVFAAGSPEPSRVYEEVYIASLPDEEQTRLREGILAADNTTLASLLEDYTS